MGIDQVGQVGVFELCFEINTLPDQVALYLKESVSRIDIVEFDPILLKLKAQ